MTKAHPSAPAVIVSLNEGRWWLGIIAMTCISLVIWLRLGQLQVVEGVEWADRAVQNRLYGSLIAPGRGVVFDRYGEPLMFNEPDYYQLLDRTALFGPTTLISQEEGLALLATDSAAVRQQFHRLYPLGPAMAHVLGYVTPVTAQELLAVNRTVSPFDQTGKQGVEQSFDRQLRGAPGEEQYEISALGIKRRLVKRTESGAGAPVNTTLDPYLSAVSFAALGDNQGAVVIADAATGAVVSLVSTPSFDPNLLTSRTSDPASESARRQAVQNLFSDERQLFFNRALSGAYPPGSIFKIVTALAALQSGTVTADTEVVDEGILRVGDFSYANWYFTQYGRTEGAISLRRALARSNDIYFYKAAEAAGPDLLASVAHTLGFGQPVGIELKSEQAGLVPDPRWKELTRGERWFLGNTYHYGIGQGDLLVTPLQVAQMMQTVANDGTKCPLHLAQTQVRNCENAGLNDEHLDLVLQGMLDACSTGGTAFPFFAWNEEHQSEEIVAKKRIEAGQVACKTGTAEFGATDERGFKKTHGWFVMEVGTTALLSKQLGENTGEVQAPETSSTASPSAQANVRSLPLYLDKTRWLQAVKQHGFPEELVIVVLVESDAARPYREGSADAGPIAKTIVDWIAGE